MKDWILLVFLLFLTMCRAMLPEDQSNWISAVNFSGILLAAMDLYIIVYRKYGNKYDKFNIIVGVAMVVGAILIVVQGLVILNIIKFGRRADDIISLLTIAMSLPNNLYCTWIGNYIKN
jgi:hypothetical protein